MNNLMSFQILVLIPEQCFSVYDFITISPTLLLEYKQASTYGFCFKNNNLMSFQNLVLTPEQCFSVYDCSVTKMPVE